MFRRVLPDAIEFVAFSHRKIVGGTERTRTVIVFVDSEVHTPFCHGPAVICDFRFSIFDWFFKSKIRNPQSKMELGGSMGFVPTSPSVTVRSFVD